MIYETVGHAIIIVSGRRVGVQSNTVFTDRLCHGK